MTNINFFAEETDFKPKQKGLIRQWLKDVASDEGFRIRMLNYIFCSDDYLLDINQQYLQHDTLTDIVTFDNSEGNGSIVGDVFISIERIRENAVALNIEEKDELHRVIIHGLLHLCGYLDKKKADKSLMTEKEDFYLSKRLF